MNSNWVRILRLKGITITSPGFSASQDILNKNYSKIPVLDEELCGTFFSFFFLPCVQMTHNTHLLLFICHHETERVEVTHSALLLPFLILSTMSMKWKDRRKENPALFNRGWFLCVFC